jgi:hypothetical protein
MALMDFTLTTWTFSGNFGGVFFNAETEGLVSEILLAKLPVFSPSEGY